MSCVFCDIVSTGAALLHEDDLTVAFLDHRPVFLGHVLIVPRDHIELLEDVPTAVLNRLFQNARLISSAVEMALEAHGTFVALNNKVSQSVPHVHVHVIPRKKKDGLRGFFWPRQAYRNEEHLELTRAVIAAAVIRCRNEENG